MWFSWLFGLAMLIAVVVAARHFSEERELARIAEQARPWWLAIAILLQGGTYLAQGETWRVVTRAAGVSVPLATAFKLSMAKLFVDQALPSAGISGTVVVAKALEQRGISHAVVMAAVVVDSVSYSAAYALTLSAALVITLVGGHTSWPIVVAGLVFVGLSAVLATIALSVAGKEAAGPKWLRRVPLLGSTLELFEDADPRLTRNLRLMVESGLFQLAILLLDAATIWVLILALGGGGVADGRLRQFHRLDPAANDQHRAGWPGHLRGGVGS